jgi:hypothetical protein
LEVNTTLWNRFDNRFLRWNFSIMLRLGHARGATASSNVYEKSGVASDQPSAYPPPEGRRLVVGVVYETIRWRRNDLPADYPP